MWTFLIYQIYRTFIISKTFIIFPRQILPGLLLQSIISRTFIFSKIAPQRTLIINNPIIQDTRVCILISPIFFLCQDSEEDSSFKVTIEEIPPKNLLNDLQKNSKSPTRRKNSARDKIDGDDPKCSSRNRITPFLLDIASKGNILIS